MAAQPLCPTCQRPLPRPRAEATAEADSPTRGKKWTRLVVVMPELEDREALEEKLDILTARYEQAVGHRVSRFVLLDWALLEVIDRNIAPTEYGA